MIVKAEVEGMDRLGSEAGMRKYATRVVRKEQETANTHKRNQYTHQMGHPVRCPLTEQSIVRNGFTQGVASQS
jgi:hypothetical protein